MRMMRMWLTDRPCNEMRQGTAKWLSVFLVWSVVFLSVARAQTGGEGAISGTVTDSTGAVVPLATVIAVNNGTGVETKRVSSSDGLYNLSPLTPGTYTVTVTANGFRTFKQENLVVNALNN